MSKDFEGWDPMAEDYYSMTFNSYSGDQIAANIPTHLMPAMSGQKCGRNISSLKLIINGFPNDITELGAKAFLRRIGCQFETIKIIKTKNQLTVRVMAFVDFNDYSSAQKAIELIHNQKAYKLYVCFTTDVNDDQQKRNLIDKELLDFKEKVMKENNEMQTTDDVIIN